MTAGGDSDDEYAPSPWGWVREQVQAFEASGGAAANTLAGTDYPIIVVTTRGAKTGKVRKTPLMRVEKDGHYALVASMGGAPKNPLWYANLRAHPGEVMVQDGGDAFAVDVRELDGAERDEWWERAVAAYPPYADYQRNTERRIPVLLATPRRRRGR